MNNDTDSFEDADRIARKMAENDSPTADYALKIVTSAQQRHRALSKRKRDALAHLIADYLDSHPYSSTKDVWGYLCSLQGTGVIYDYDESKKSILWYPGNDKELQELKYQTLAKRVSQYKNIESE